MRTVFLVLVMCFTQEGMNQEVSKVLTIKFEGQYITGRGPCEWLTDGSRRWAKTVGFNITRQIKGDLEVAYIEIEAFDIENQSINKLEAGNVYVVIINLSKKRFQELKLNIANTVMTYRNPIRNYEIIKIAKKYK